jgi:hypothetical protein
MQPISFEMRNEKLTIREVGVYADGSPALRVTDTEGQPWSTLTVFVPGAAEFREPDEYVIKTWNENEETYRRLLDLGVLKPTGKTIQAGFCLAQFCKVNVP